MAPVAGRPDLGAFADARQGEAARHLDRRVEQQLTRDRDTTADRHHVGIEGVERVGDPDPEPLAQGAQGADRLRVAGLGRLDGIVAGHVLPGGGQPPQRGGGSLGGDPRSQVVQDPTRGQGLERAGLRKRDRRRHAVAEVDADQGVAELGRGARRAPVQLPVQHQPAADPRPHREHDQVPDHRLTRFVERLGEGRQVGVVVDEHRQPEALLEHAAEVEVGQVKVDARAHPAGGELDHRGHPDPDGRGASVPHLVDARDDLVHQARGAGDLGGPDEGLAQQGVLERRDGHLGAAQVDANQLATEHGRSIYLPARPGRGGRDRRALPAGFHGPVANVDDARAKRPCLDELQLDSLVQGREVRRAAAEDDRADEEPVLVDEPALD